MPFGADRVGNNMEKETCYAGNRIDFPNLGKLSGRRRAAARAEPEYPVNQNARLVGCDVTACVSDYLPCPRTPARCDGRRRVEPCVERLMFNALRSGLIRQRHCAWHGLLVVLAQPTIH